MSIRKGGIRMVDNWKTRKWGVAIAFLLMVMVNALANILPINGITTGDISDSYANLFAPTGLTFSIWGVIYLLLAFYVVMTVIQSQGGGVVEERDKVVARWFMVSSLANTIWIFMWHYQIIWASLAMMFVILISLIMIALEIRKHPTVGLDRVKIALPFHVYFGWITVATIANVTTFLVDISWDGFGISEATWMMIILVVGTLIGLASSIFFRSISYGLVILWAYFGIYLKHTDPNQFASVYSNVIFTVTVCMVLLVLGILYVGRKKMK